MMLEALQSTQDPDWVFSHEGCGVLTESAVESLFAFGNRFMGMRAARSISPGPTGAGRLGYSDRPDRHGSRPRAASLDAVIDATTHRLRPIVLTAAAASLGMIPIASEVFWGPMAYAIIGGLFVATLLTLLFLPALYVAWFRIKEPRKEPEPGLGAEMPAVAK